MTKKEIKFLTDAQLLSEIERCEFCEEKPCKEACPADCSPADFIMAVRKFHPSDFERAAALIYSANPLGGICGAVCPDRHCMAACSRKTFDNPINIPAVQATIIEKAKEMKVLPRFNVSEPNSFSVAVIGGGPAGLGAASALVQMGYEVTIFEESDRLGGMCNLIPDTRLDKSVLKSDIEFLLSLGNINVKANKRIENAESLLDEYDAVLVAVGLSKPFTLKITGSEHTIDWITYLRDYKQMKIKGKNVAIIGGGAVAVDCAIVAKESGAETVELFALEKLSELPITKKEFEELIEYNIHISFRTRVRSVKKHKNRLLLETLKVFLKEDTKFHPSLVRDVGGTEQTRNEFDFLVQAIGARGAFNRIEKKGVFYAGDFVNGPTTVVEAVASGKNAATRIDAFLKRERQPKIKRDFKSVYILKGFVKTPVPLNTKFFGQDIISPFILSAAPPSDGYDQMKKAYEAGWAGGVMKTTFDNVPIHIPSEYMFAFSKSTYANCDNVSAHPLERVAKEAERLVREFPDRLTIVSTGGPVTGNDEEDSKVWQSNTRKLESVGVKGIEYSLSCPQGGDGTKGDIVSQNPELTAKIVDWVMQVSDPNIPKLFKLTAAVTSIYPIVKAIKDVFDRFPEKKAGITLANTFPTLAFRKGNKKRWEEGIIVGMSGEGILPISYLTLANVSKMSVEVSGNGGPMDYKAAADFLALGVNTVQFCTIVMKYGYGIINDLMMGVSYLMKDRGFSSVLELRGAALPQPITPFMELSSVKKISQVKDYLCQHCGNCTRCPYLAIKLNRKRIPETDPSRCIGCSICVQKCFAGALYMRDRTERELKMLSEK
ncbi:MAG: FAD-dependent oxidoreductase [Deltaproteobacteria bacterium]|nr:FAD-dependent oxidoreductase [Deltaproteobacteria bacterium]